VFWLYGESISDGCSGDVSLDCRFSYFGGCACFSGELVSFDWHTGHDNRVFGGSAEEDDEAIDSLWYLIVFVHEACMTAWQFAHKNGVVPFRIAFWHIEHFLLWLPLMVWGIDCWYKVFWVCVWVCVLAGFWDIVDWDGAVMLVLQEGQDHLAWSSSIL
jgi:hypothetical protein